MAITNWITSTEVVALAVKRNSYDTAIIEGNIGLTQMKYIRPFLGDDFFNEINDSIGSLSADNTALMVYLKYGLAYLVIYESFWQNEMKQTTKGAMVDLSEYGQKPSSAQLELARTDLLNKANSWLDLAQQFITDQQEIDSSKFPNYESGTSDKAQKSTSTYYVPD